MAPIEVKWTIRLLGRLEVVSSSQETVRIPSRTALSLLAYLSLNRAREASNDELQGLFWPESDGDKQAQNLRRSIADLRKVLERDLPLGAVIVTRKGYVSLNQDRVATDVERFLDLTRHSEEDQTRLAEAVGLYAGPLLAPLSNDWMKGHRMELEERFGQTVDRLCGLLIEQGSVKEAINIGRAAVVAAPSREDVHIALIQAYRLAGMSVEALRQFEELERILDETWGETPSARAREALEAAFAENQPRKHNLPEQLTSFIGREKEIEEVCELLSKTRLLTLTGSGGCGKTRLSLQVASRVLDQYRDGVWFVEFAPLADPGLVPNTVAAALGLSEQPSKSIEQTLLDYLKAKRLLLVLDNCEHLLLACSQVAEAVLRHCPSVVILANSREGLAIGGELVYRVPSLSLPNPREQQTPESLAQCESVQLFVERATHVQRAFAVTDQNAAALASICQRLDGIPLAIELAAARLRSLSVEEINAKLDQRFRLLTGGSRTALPRQQTLRSLIDWSYDLLNEAEKALLCRLAVFAGGWTLESAEQVCSGGVVLEGEVLDLLTSLCDKNLVVADEDDGATRYRMLETVRQYARDRLLEGSDGERWRDRHQTYFLDLAEEAEPHLTGPDQRAWLERLEAEHDNLRAALEWSSAAGGGSYAGLQLAGALSRFWARRGHLGEGRGWLEAMLAVNPVDELTAARAKALSGSGRLAWLQGDHDASRTHCQQSLALQRELGDRLGAAESLNTLGNATLEQGEPSLAQPFYAESLALRRELGDKAGVAQSLGNLANVAYYQGDYGVGLAWREEGLAIFREVGDKHGIAGSLVNLAGDARIQGDYESAKTAGEESLAIFREVGDKRGIARALGVLGETARSCSELPGARRALEESLSIFQDLGDRRSVAGAQLSLGEFELENREYSAALAHCKESLSSCAEARYVNISSTTLQVVASILAAHAEPDRAARLWGAAESLRAQRGISLIVPKDRATYERGIATARAAMADDEAFDRAWQEGRALTMEQAIELALAQDRLGT